MPIDFSVVIPTFRRSRELMEAITSALGQAGVTLEILVVDDCPEGSAQQAVEGLQDARVTYLRNPTPTGGVPSVVRNLAWPIAKGHFIHFLDDDDIVPEGHYAAVKGAFESHTGVGLVFGKIEPFGIGPEQQLQHERRYFADAARSALACGRFGKRLAFTGRCFSTGRSSSAVPAWFAASASLVLVVLTRRSALWKTRTFMRVL